MSDDKSLIEKILREVIFHQMISNPLPWRIEQDWTVEVIAANNPIIAKCKDRAVAEEILKIAEGLRQELDNIEPGNKF